MRRRRQEYQDSFEDPIDLTPMVNVSLILVIVFMCVSPMALISGINAVSSNSSKNSEVALGQSAKEDIVKIVLAKDGTITINNALIDRKLLVPYLKDAILMSPVKQVMITADTENLVQDVVYLMDISKQNGADKVTLSE
jgi:biopolymer transport protein ExbD